jgi:3-hydroxymyristoyl/3-hydroxydecanoyl-(acyl carrier protein) dehydratase
MILKMDGGCSGFFSDEELAKAKGLVSTRQNEAQGKIPLKRFKPIRISPKSVFSQEEVLLLSEGNIAACFGDTYYQNGLNPSLRLPPKPMLMIDQVTSVDPIGGACGLGLIVGEKKLAPEDWYFRSHFKDDPAFPGSLMAEGCAQLMQFYLLFLGMQASTVDARFQPIPHLRQAVRYRGQVTPVAGTLTYRLEVTEIGLSPLPFAKGDAAIIFDGKTIATYKNLGVQLSEKNRR